MTRRTLWVTVVAIAAVVLSASWAMGATTTLRLAPGQEQPIECATKLTVSNKTSKGVTVTCAPAPTTTTTTTRPATTTTAAPTTTTAAPTTTTAAPTTTTTTTTTAPPPPNGVFPTAASTGVPAGTTLTSSGAITVTVAGTVIDAKNITGGVWVRANNVTIQRSKITVGGGQSSVGISIDAGRTGTRIVDSEIVANNGFTGVIGGGGFTAQRVNIHGFENGIEIRGSASVVDSYIVLADFRYSDGTIPHFDAVSGWSVDGVTLRHNTLTAPPDQTGAINFTNDFGPIVNVTIDNNLLTGGGYALYLRGDSSWNSPTAGKPVRDITVTNNRFGKSQWGYASIVNAQVTLSGNTNTSGAPILGN
jgi:hypothetical protein